MRESFIVPFAHSSPLLHSSVELEIVQGLARETPFLEGNKRTLTVIVRSDTQPTMTWSVNGQELTSSNSTYMIGSVVAGNVNARGLTDYSISLSMFFLNTTYQGEYRLVAEVPSDGLVVETAGRVLQESELLSFHDYILTLTLIK